MTESMLAAVRDAAAGNGGGEALTPAALEAARAESHAAGRTEGIALGRTEGAAAERSRILGIQAAAFAGQEALAAELIGDGATTPEAAALRFNTALKAKGPNHVAALSAMDAQARVPANGTAQGGGNGGEKKTYSQDREGWMAEWKDTPALRADYVTAEDYAAARKIEAEGRVKTASKRAAA